MYHFNIREATRSYDSLLYNIVLCHTCLHLFSYPNDFSYLNTFQNEKVHRALDN